MLPFFLFCTASFFSPRTFFFSTEISFTATEICIFADNSHAWRTQNVLPQCRTVLHLLTPGGVSNQRAACWAPGHHNNGLSVPAQHFRELLQRRNDGRPVWSWTQFDQTILNNGRGLQVDPCTQQVKNWTVTTLILYTSQLRKSYLPLVIYNDMYSILWQDSYELRHVKKLKKELAMADVIVTVECWNLDMHSMKTQTKSCCVCVCTVCAWMCMHAKQERQKIRRRKRERYSY